MKLVLCLFIVMSNLYGQLECKRDSIDLSSKVGCVIEYKYLGKNEFWQAFADGYDNNNQVLNTYSMSLQSIVYFVPSTILDIAPMYKDETRELSEYLKRVREADHDSIIYEYLKKELEPNHFSSGY